MNSVFSINYSEPNAHIRISNYLYPKLIPILKINRPIIVLCIGSDRCTGDALGPLVGYKLNNIKDNYIYIYGCLESPVHATNLQEILSKINSAFDNPFIIAIDACLGSVNNIGDILIRDEPLKPGVIFKKNLPPVGDISIKGIVNISNTLNYLVLQNTRLSIVMSLADIISNSIFNLSLMLKNSKVK